MQPTDEQQAVLNDGNRIIRINARAGTGKTTTLQMLSAKDRTAKILYLVFNRKAREEAKEKFPSNVEVHTVHSLAYRHEGYKWNGQLKDFGPLDMLPSFRRFGKPHLLATIAHGFLTFFLNSPHRMLEDAVAEFPGILPEEVRGLYEHHKERMLEASRKIATDWNRKDKPCPHDFYLKMFHKSGEFIRVLNGYDMVLVDEAQDLSPVMIDALRHCTARMIIVGDSHQQIYGFRYAVDAMRKLRSDRDYALTLSFRFGKAIADLATLFIREAKQDLRFQISGNPGIDSVVKVSEGFPLSGCAILSRSNLALFNRVLELSTRGAGFQLERDIGAVVRQVLDAYWLYREEVEKVRSEWLRSFGSFPKLEQYAEECEEHQLTGICQIVRRHHGVFPGMLFDLMETAKNAGGAGRGDAIVLSTIHSAKGQEYEKVFIDPDVADTMKAAEKADTGRYEEEVNVAYVGITRAARQLILPSAFQRILTPEWRDRLDGLQIRARKRPNSGTPMPSATKAPPYSKKKLKIVEGKSRKERDPARTPSLEKGDCVNTPNGTGTIVEIAGKRCLVDLDEQACRVWERLTTVRPCT